MKPLDSDAPSADLAEKAAGNSPGVDLSEGVLSPAQAKAVNLGIEEQSHRIGLQKTVFTRAMGFAAFMLGAALAMAFWAFTLYACQEKFDWHVALLVGAFLLPSTVIMVALIRAAFPKAASKDDSDFPSVEAIKQLKDLFDLMRLSQK
jgi:hypothetical protein